MQTRSDLGAVIFGAMVGSWAAIGVGIPMLCPLGAAAVFLLNRRRKPRSRERVRGGHLSRSAGSGNVDIQVTTPPGEVT